MSNDTTTKEIFARLAEPFMPSDLEWKIQTANEATGKALALVYIDARAVMDRLDSVLGPENWRDEYTPGPMGGVLCTLHIRINGEWLSKTDGADNTDVEAIKGGISDSFKRAAVKWGIGRYLYSFPKVWCRFTTVGKAKVLVERPAVPEWAYPKDYQGEKEKPNTMILLRDVPQEEMDTPKRPAAPKPVATSTAAQSPDNAPAAEAQDDLLARAAAYVIPRNLPMKGKTLGEAVKDEKLGKALVMFLAGRQKNRAGELFTPTTDEETKLKNAANYLLDHLPA